MSALRFLLALLLVATAQAANRPNFIVILADDMGYGDISPYGGWIETPHLDRLASEGLRFTDFHSNGAVCSPTRAAFVTGRYQQRAGIPGVVYADTEREVHYHGLQPSEHTFAELLQKQGYATGMFGKWHLGYYPKYSPVRHGFDLFRGYVSGNIDFISHIDQAGTFDWWRDDERSDEPGYVTHIINRHAVHFIEQNRDRPFCLYLPHEAPHYPYQVPGDPPFRKAGDASPRQELGDAAIKKKYREMVEILDDGVGQILRTLTRLGIEDQTLVFFFSDNGATPQGSNGELRGHKGSVWEGGHRVPAIARWLGKIAAGAETGQLAMGFDLMPTMLDLAGAAVPDGHDLDGISLVPVLLRGEEIDRGPVFWQHGDAVAMRDGSWKYVANQRGLDGPGLFDLEASPAEQENQARTHPDRTNAMAGAVVKWQADVAASATPQPARRLEP